MAIAKTVKRWLLVTSGFLLLSSLTWGQAWAPRAEVRVEFGAPARFVEVNRRWDRDREWREREWREREWRERERREEWHRHHRREERRQEWRERYRRY